MRQIYSVSVYITYGYLKRTWPPVRLTRAANTLSMPPKDGGCYPGWLAACLCNHAQIPGEIMRDGNLPASMTFYRGRIPGDDFKEFSSAGRGAGEGLGWDGMGGGGSFHHCVSRLRDITQHEAMMGERRSLSD